MAVVPIPLMRSRVTVQVGEGEFEAELSLGEIEDLQSLTGLGPEVILKRLQDREYYVGEIFHTIRLGLIGAGMDPNRALAIVNRNVRSPYWHFYIDWARIILMAAITGLPHDPVGEPEAVTTILTEMSEDFGDSLTSIGSEAPPDSPPDK